MSLASPFFNDVLVALSDKTEFSDELKNCIQDIAVFFARPIDWNNIDISDSLDIYSIHKYEKLLGIQFQPVSLGTEIDIKNLYNPLLIRLGDSKKFRVYIPNQSRTHKKSFEKFLLDKSNQIWQCCVINNSLPSSFREIISLLFSHFKKDFLVSLGLALVVSTSALIVSFFSGYLFSHVHTINFNHNYLETYIPIFLFLLSLILIYYISQVCFNLLNNKISTRVQPSLWNHILKLPFKSFGEFSSGDFVQRIMSYESVLSSFVTVTFDFFVSILTILCLILYMMCCNFFVSVVYLSSYFVSVIIKIIFLQKKSQWEYDYLVSQGKISSFLNEALLQIDKIRSSNREYVISTQWLKHLITAKSYTEKSVNLEIRISLIDLFIPILNSCFFYVYLYLNTRTFDAYCCLQFMICAGQLSFNFEKLSSGMLMLITLLPALKRISPIIHQEIEKFSIKSTNDDFVGNIQLSNIFLKDSQTGSAILEDISMNIEPGSFVALVGASGAGKSTIFNLLLGFEQNYTGTISIDGINIKKIDMNGLRRQFGVVLQSSHLFPGTIFSNIAVNATITLDDAWRLARLVGLDDEVNAMPMKMYTHLSDNSGESISGGQKQKILIARALATNPKILMLDEATSALDNASQSFIFDHLKSLNMTLLVIAHRYSTIVGADKVYELNRGKII